MTEPDPSITILVVDDDPSVRKLLLGVLQRQGYTVVEAADAAQALGVLDHEDIGLVLLDLRMPGPADGEDLLFLLRDRGDDVPIIVVSGWVDDEALLHQPDCVQAVLRKPVGVQQLTDTVRQVLALA